MQRDPGMFVGGTVQDGTNQPGIVFVQVVHGVNGNAAQSLQVFDVCGAPVQALIPSKRFFDLAVTWQRKPFRCANPVCRLFFRSVVIVLSFSGNDPSGLGGHFEPDLPEPPGVARQAPASVIFVGVFFEWDILIASLLGFLHWG